MSRDELLVLYKKVSRYYDFQLNDYGRAVVKEYQGRWNSAKAAQDEQVKKIIAAESEFYLEVKEALMAEGKAEHVAANLINTEAKMLAQAKRLGVI